MTETTFSFIPRAARSAKPRKTGLTEIRGPYYSAYGPRHLADLFETVGAWVDGIKYAGGSFALMPPEAVKAINKVAHDHDAYVSTGGWIENVLRFGADAVDRYLGEAKALGFDVIEISAAAIGSPSTASRRRRLITGQCTSGCSTRKRASQCRMIPMISRRGIRPSSPC